MTIEQVKEQIQKELDTLFVGKPASEQNMKKMKAYMRNRLRELLDEDESVSS